MRKRLGRQEVFWGHRQNRSRERGKKSGAPTICSSCRRYEPRDSSSLQPVFSSRGAGCSLLRVGLSERYFRKRSLVGLPREVANIQLFFFSSSAHLV